MDFSVVALREQAFEIVGVVARAGRDESGVTHMPADHAWRGQVKILRMGGEAEWNSGHAAGEPGHQRRRVGEMAVKQCDLFAPATIGDKTSPQKLLPNVE